MRFDSFRDSFDCFANWRRPSMHTRNLAALEAAQRRAWLAGVPIRVHGEHGRDMGDLDGTSRRYRRVRRLYRPFVSRTVLPCRRILSGLYATPSVRIRGRSRRSTMVSTRHDSRRRPMSSARIEGCPFTDDDFWLVGTVGRLQQVKDQVTLAEAFVRAIKRGHGRWLECGWSSSATDQLKARVERVPWTRAGNAPTRVAAGRT